MEFYELFYNWNFIFIALGIAAVVLIASFAYHQVAKRKHGHLITEDTYSDDEVLAHKGQNRIFELANTQGMPALAQQGAYNKMHAQFGPLVLRVQGRRLKNIVIAGFFAVMLGIIWFLFYSSGTPISEVTIDRMPSWAFPVMLAVIGAYAVYRLYLCTCKIELYRDGMVIGTLFTKKEIDYNDIAQILPFNYMKDRQTRGTSWFRYRRGWGMRFVLRSGKPLEVTDSKYARVQRYLTRWMDSLTWEGEPVAWQPEARQA